MRPVTPRGYRDVLAVEAAERDALVTRMNGALASWGYDYVETPIVENYESLAAVAGDSLKSDLFRLFDSDGSLLALRPEMTVPVARLVATRLGVDSGPHRLRYSGRVFREQPSMRGQSREFMQVGVELIGTNGSESDAEVISLMADALDAAGLPEYTIAVGTVAILRALIITAEMDEEWDAAVYAAAHDRNLVAIAELASTQGVPEDVADALRTVPGIRGGREAIDASRTVAGTWAAEVFDELETTWDLLVAQRCDQRVSIDFGIMRSFDYYTGMVLEAYGSGPGLPLGGGGRYDGVLAAFDTPAPAAGFALRVERVHEALTSQGVELPSGALDAVVGGSPTEAFTAAAELRSLGWRVRLVPGSTGDALLEAAELAGARTVVLAEGDGMAELSVGLAPRPLVVENVPLGSIDGDGGSQ